MLNDVDRSHGRRRILYTILAIGVALVLLIASSAPALADTGQEFTRFWVEATANDDGTIDAQIDLEFDFGAEESHGVYLTYLTRQRIEDDPNHYRLLEYSNIEASSTTAPADVRVERSSDGMGIYVGDPDVEITGTHEYTISFTVAGVVNAGVGDDGEDEVFWNVIGSGFEQPLEDVQVTLTGPVFAEDAACWYGEVGSTTTCTDVGTQGGSVTYSQTHLAAGEGMTIAAAYPGGTFPGVEPILGERETFANSMGGGVIVGAAVLASVLLAIVIPMRVSYMRRDERFAGLPPGVFPSEGMPISTERAPRKIDAAVQFTPPEGLRPSDVGLITRGSPKAQFFAAMLVDLAVRGHLQITTNPGKRGRAGWQLTRLHYDTAGTTDEEALLLNAVFAEDTAVTLNKLPRSGRERIAGLTRSEGVRMKTAGWFTSRFGTAAGVTMGLGALVLAAGILTVVFGAFRGWGALGVPIIVAGVTLMLLGGRATKRTPTGHAYYVQALGFKKYLETAEAGQLRFEAGEDIFSKYLPYAMVFGVVKRWVGVFEELAARGRWDTTPSWYLGAASGAALFSSSGEMNAFTSNLTGLESAVSMASMTGSSSGSSGRSAFSGGGFSGGGVGGGGGGSW